jgi:maltooligosyltrehalose synthase
VGAWAIFAAPRLVASRSAPRKRLLAPQVFGEDVLTLPPKSPRSWRNVLTSEELTAGGSKDAKTIRLADLFANFPVALLEGM